MQQRPEAMESRSERDWQRARGFFEQGNVDAAKAVCETMLGRDADNPSAHWLLSTIDLGRGNFRSAVLHAQRTATRAGSLPIHQATATCQALISVGEYRSAHSLLLALDAEAANGLALVAIAEQLILLEDYASALHRIDVATRRGMRHPILSFLRSNALKFSGRRQDAIDALEDTLSLEPNHAHAHWSLADLGTPDDAGRRIDRIRRAMPRAVAPTPGVDSLSDSEHRAVLGYALFKEFDALGDTGAAWQALEAAMALKKGLVDYQPEVEDAIFDRLIDTYSPEFMTAAESIPAVHVPVFIVGMPRTGTTVLERIIGNHSQVSSGGELNEMQMQVKWATDHYCPDFVDTTVASRLASVDAGALAQGYLAATAWRAAGRPWLTDKHQSNFLFCGMILRSMPQARIVHMRRDPMDSCFSNLKELFSPHMYSYSYALGDVAHHYGNYSRLMRHVAAAAPGRILELRYEDLARDPAAEARRVLQFCGLPDEGDLSDITRNSRPVSSASSVQVRDSIHANNIGGWKRYAGHLGPLQALLNSSD